MSGSALVARMAGINVARMPTIAIETVVVAKVVRSKGLTPYNIELKSRVAAKLPASPRRIPVYPSIH